MRAKFLLVSLTLLALSAAASPQKLNPDEFCPKLPADSGLTWAFEPGVDYSQCFASSKKDAGKKEFIGIYFGGWPEFDPRGRAPVRDGTINNESIKWYKRESTDGKFKFGLETLLPKHKRDVFVGHIWLLAQDEESLLRLVTIAEGFKFERPGEPD